MDSDTDVMVLSFVPSTRDGRAGDHPGGRRKCAASSTSWKARTGCCSTAASIRTSPATSRAWTSCRRSGASAPGRPTRSTARTAKATFCPTTSAFASSRRRARSASRTSACTRGCRSAASSYEHSQCSDIGVVAKRYPDVNFLIYHSGFVSTVTEKAYDASGQRDGIDTLDHFAAEESASSRTAMCMRSSAAPGAS